MRPIFVLLCTGIGCILGLAPASSSRINGRSLDGDELTCDLPASEHLANIGSRVDGRGMCVMTSIEMAARWHGLESMRGLRDWCARQPGGAYPAKVDRQIRQFCAAQGVPVPPYAQYEGSHIEAILDRCDRTGRLACVTYGESPRYSGTIAHMVCCVRFGSRYGVALDNNFPGVDSYEWMSRAEMRRRIVHPNGRGWVFVWLAPPPPPPPFNLSASIR
jgi:hypothetical protein